MFLLLLTVAIILIFYHVSTQYSRRGRILNKLPGPSTFPLIGNLPLFMCSSTKLWKVLRGLTKKYYPISRIWILHYSVVYLSHPDDAEILLSSMKHIEKSRLYDFLHPWLKTGLLTSTGKKWQHRRKMLTPAFHFNVLQQFLDIFVEQGNNLVKNLKSQGDETIQNVVPLFTKYTLNTICETAMGTVLHEADIQNSYRTALTKLVEIMLYRAFRPWLHNKWIFKLLSNGKEYEKYLSVLHNFSRKIIKERKEYHEETENQYLKSISTNNQLISSVVVDDDGIKGQKKRMAMLDHLIAAQKFGKQIDDEGIREEVDTFIFEGHDTTAMAMCFAVLMLAEHKDVQDRVRKEVDYLLDGKNGKITSAEVQNMNYLEQCIKETLRLYPSVPFIARKVNEDLQLKHCFIPAGTIVDLHIFDLHRDPNFWPNPEKYDPDRFLPEKMHNRHPFSYVPFSGGPRNCIGQRFAMLELKALLAHLIYNFIFEPIDNSQDIIFTADLVLRTESPIRVKFISRIK
uniref:cytochrome P450 4C1-like n=1 Tax=Leptopilina boulardi TaxID=63433 RepID=UPI003B5B31EC